MTYDIYRYIFIGAAVLCGIMLVVSVLIFIFLKIPKIIRDLSGITARRAIKNIREQNEASGEKVYKVSAFNEARGKLTDKISQSGALISNSQGQMRGIDTTKIATQHLQQGVEENSQTTVLDAYQETSVLGGYQETSVLGGYQETSVLGTPGMGETAILSGSYGGDVFAVEYEITFIHTDEIIVSEAMV